MDVQNLHSKDGITHNQCEVIGMVKMWKFHILKFNVFSDLIKAFDNYIW